MFAYLFLILMGFLCPSNPGTTAPGNGQVMTTSDDPGNPGDPPPPPPPPPPPGPGPGGEIGDNPPR